MESEFKMIDFQRIDEEIRPRVREFISKYWGSELMISRGRIHVVADLDGFVITEGEAIIGLITFSITSGECEIVSLDSVRQGQGIGSMLINLVTEVATKSMCKRLWLYTTNDNTNALKFYQKRGFDICGFYHNSVDLARQVKPEIPKLGCHGLEIKHEFELERLL